MINIQLKVRFPDEYLKYDDIESLWHYSIENSSNNNYDDNIYQEIDESEQNNIF